MLELADRYATVMLSEVPLALQGDPDARFRFADAVDVSLDTEVRLILLAWQRHDCVRKGVHRPRPDLDR
jgi:predicted ATPase